MVFKLFRRRGDHDEAAEALYAAIAVQARQPAFFDDFGVPDTVLGRFEMVALHAFLVFRCLRDTGQDGRALAQATHDRMFADIDVALRELGIGDMGIGKRVKSLARNLYGRIAAYDAGLDSDDGALREALARNVYATAETPRDAQLAALAGYMRREDTNLRTQDDAALLAGRVAFGAVPAVAEGPAVP
ncbi:MAG: ubiquinol-cytochrome C chaperone family protein [Alphaproteobacteria bacterium]|jgi:cytochrome b pre-mRNA-processing protein 3